MTFNRNFSVRSYGIEIGIIFLLILVTGFINWKMIIDGVPVNSHDIYFHITWLQHFYKELSEGIVYPRWLAGTNFGYGSPTFVFYPPLVYYIGSLLKLIGFTTEQAIIGLFSLAIFGIGLGFYIYGRHRWGRLAALIGSLVFMTAPYVKLNIYTRGALAETSALALIPLGLWLTEKAISHPRWRVGLAIFFSLLALTHLPSLLICTIFWLSYNFIYLLRHSWKKAFTLLGFALIGFGLVAFYLFPVIFEKSIVNIEVMKLDVDGFPFFKTNLLGSPIVQGSGGKFFHTSIIKIFIDELLSIIIVATAYLFSYRNSSLKQPKEIWFWITLLLVLSFLMSYFSLPIWQASPTLQSIQFPWRLLGLFSLGMAALSSLAVSGIYKGNFSSSSKIILSLAIAIIFSSNILYLLYTYKASDNHQGFHNHIKADPHQLTWKHWKLIETALDEPYKNKLVDVPEYRPLLKNAQFTPAPVIGQPPVSVVSGKASIQIEKWASYHRKFNVVVEEASTLKVRTYYYPAWKLYINQKNNLLTEASDGTIELSLKPGSYTVELDYLWTFAFKLGIVASIFSAATLILAWIKSSKTRHF